MRTDYRLWAIGLVILAILAPRAGAEDTAAPIPPQQYLLLRNGQVLEGRVQRDADQYVVSLSNGQIRVRCSDVEMVCNSLLDGYQHKRAALQVGNVNQHLGLALWCLHHHLLDKAAAELADATDADPRNPMIEALQRRLAVAKAPPAATAPVATQSPPPLLREDLDRMTRSLPHGSVEYFVRSVQPVLMHHCMSSGCHGLQNETKLQLHRTDLGSMTSRYLTQRNLFALLKYVDRDNPAASPLLRCLTGPHGVTQTPVFSERDSAQLQHVMNWVNLVGYRLGGTTVPASVQLELPDETPTPGAAEQSPAASPRILSRAARKANPLDAAQRKLSQKDEALEARRTPNPAVQPVADPGEDPFDPELFNRLPTAKK